MHVFQARLPGVQRTILCLIKSRLALMETVPFCAMSAGAHDFNGCCLEPPISHSAQKAVKKQTAMALNVCAAEPEILRGLPGRMHTSSALMERLLWPLVRAWPYIASSCMSRRGASSRLALRGLMGCSWLLL